MEETCELFCGNLDPKSTPQELYSLFSSVAPCTVTLRSAARRNEAEDASTYAFVSFSSPQLAAAAQQRFHKCRLNGRSLRVVPRTHGPAGAGWSRGQHVPAATGFAPARGHCVSLWGLPSSITSQQLMEHAAVFGHVLSTSVADGTSGAAMGTGVCMFASSEAAALAAAAWQGACILGSSIGAEVLPQPAQAHGPQSSLRGNPSTKKKTPFQPAVVVRNLSPTTTRDTLLQIFGIAGSIRRLRLVMEESGFSAGVAFITFTSLEGMRAALALGEAGLQVDGVQPTVSPAHSNLAAALIDQQPAGNRQAVPWQSGASRPAVVERQQQPQQPQQSQQQPRQPQQSQQQPQQPQQPGDQPGAVRAVQPQPLCPQPQQQQQHEAGAEPQRPVGQPPWGMQPAALGQRSSQAAADSMAVPMAAAVDQLSSQPGSWRAAGGAGPRVMQPAPGYGPSAAHAVCEPSHDTLFVRPLGPGLDEAALLQLFSSQEGLVSARVLRHPDGTSKGCGFVRFAEHAQAQHALNTFDGANLVGRSIKLSWAVHRQPASSQSWDRNSTSSMGGSGGSAEFGSGEYGTTSGTPQQRYGRQQQRLHPSYSEDGVLLAPHGREPSPSAPVAVLPVMAASPGYPAGAAMLVPVYYHHHPAAAPYALQAPLAAYGPASLPGSQHMAGTSGGAMVNRQGWDAQPRHWQPAWVPPSPQQQQQAAAAALRYGVAGGSMGWSGGSWSSADGQQHYPQQGAESTHQQRAAFQQQQQQQRAWQQRQTQWQQHQQQPGRVLYSSGHAPPHWDSAAAASTGHVSTGEPPPDTDPGSSGAVQPDTAAAQSQQLEQLELLQVPAGKAASCDAAQLAFAAQAPGSSPDRPASSQTAGSDLITNDDRCGSGTPELDGSDRAIRLDRQSSAALELLQVLESEADGSLPTAKEPACLDSPPVRQQQPPRDAAGSSTPPLMADGAVASPEGPPLTDAASDTDRATHAMQGLRLA